MYRVDSGDEGCYCERCVTISFSGGEFEEGGECWRNLEEGGKAGLSVFVVVAFSDW